MRAQIEKLMTSINWQDAFRDRPPREDLTLRRKQEDETFLVKFPLGLRGGHVVLPQGPDPGAEADRDAAASDAAGGAHQQLR